MASSIDPRGARFGQGATGILALAAYAAPLEALVPVLAVVLAAGALAGPGANLWSLVWLKAVQPALRIGPPAKAKAAAPVRFANGVGALFLGAATVLLYAAPGVTLLGFSLAWALVLVVAALALLAAATDLCVGCEMYVRLQRLRGAAPRDA